MSVDWAKAESVVATEEGLLVTQRSDYTLGAAPILIPYTGPAQHRPLPSSISSGPSLYVVRVTTAQGQYLVPAGSKARADALASALAGKVVGEVVHWKCAPGQVFAWDAAAQEMGCSKVVVT
jgi:hypothetical protein